MKNFLTIILVFFLLVHEANAQVTSQICQNVTAGGITSCVPIGSSNPLWISGSGGVTTFSGGTTGLTPNAATNGAVTLGGVLGVANGGTGVNYYSHLLPKLQAVQKGTGSARICFAGDSTIFGSWSTANNAGNIVFQSMPTQVSNFLVSNYGIPSDWQAFIGDQGTTETYGTNDSRVVLGQWSQDTSNITIGGRSYKTTTVNGTALTFTPATSAGAASGDTFRFLYITQSGGGTLQAQIDSETPITYSTSGTSGIVPVVLKSTVGVSSHTIKFTMSAGSQVNLVGVSEFYDSTQPPTVHIVNMGWPAATAANWNVTTNGFSPSNSAAWTAMACDLVIYEGGINDWQASVSPSSFSTSMQSTISAMVGGGGDVALLTPVPSITTTASAAAQQAIVDTFFSLATTNSLPPPLDNFARWQSYTIANAKQLYNPSGSAAGLHPQSNGYGEEATAVAFALAAKPGQLNNGLGYIGTTIFYDPLTINGTGGGTPLILNDNNATATQIELTNSSGGHQINIGAGGSSFPNGFLFANDSNISTNLFGASGTTFSLVTGDCFGWSTSTTLASGSQSLNLCRLAAGKLAIGNGTNGDFTGALAVGSIGVGTATPQATLDVRGLIKSNGYTVSALPTGSIGDIGYVTDQTTACPLPGSALTGGGGIVCAVFFNGSSWVGL